MSSELQLISPAPSRRLAIRNLVPRLPERGKIKIGIKGQEITSDRGNKFQPPQKLDHFVITTLERDQKTNNVLRDEEIHQQLGDAPREIPIRLLYDDPALNFMTRYACFIGRTLWCSGDGEEATRISEEAPKTKSELDALKPNPHIVPCTCFRQDPRYNGRDRCKMNGNLSVIIDGASGLGGVWNFRTTSFNSITGILSSLSFIRQVTGGILANIPLKLLLQPKQATRPIDGVPVTIYVAGVEYPGKIEDLQKIAHEIALARATTHVSIADIENEARRRLLAAPMTTALPADDNAEIVDEFYPEQREAEIRETSEKPARPRREDFQPNTQEAAETTAINFMVTDYVGEVKDFTAPEAAVSGYKDAAEVAIKQDGPDGLEAMEDNNKDLLAALREHGHHALAEEIEQWHDERCREFAGAENHIAGTADSDTILQG